VIAISQKAVLFLKDWSFHYIKSRDVIKKEIIEIKQEKDRLLVEYKNRVHTYHIVPFIKNLNTILDNLKKDQYYSIITFNSKPNLNMVISHWELMIKFQNLNVFFVNPFSSTDKKWIIHPHIHNRVCEKPALEKGLRALFDGVEAIEEKEIEGKMGVVAE